MCRVTVSEVVAIAEIEVGDEAWWTGDRKTARDAWRRALDAADTSPVGRAAEAMARIRLLTVSGNLGPFVHEARLNRALAACPETEPWCEVAWADWNLYMPAFVEANPDRVPGGLVGNPLDAAYARARIARSGARPEDPGTWVVGVGLSGAAGSGVGVSARFSHPDLFWDQHRLDASAAIDSLGGRSVAGSVTTHGPFSWQASAAAARTVGYAWFAGNQTRYTTAVEKFSTGVASRVGDLTLQVGATARAERESGTDAWEAGPYLTLSAMGPAASARLASEANFGTYAHLLVAVDVRAAPRLAGGTLAVRGYGATAPLPDTPYWRLPDAGGANLLRGAPTGRWRDDTLFAGQIELRHPIYGPLEGAVFLDTAHVDGWHATAGGGVRIVLPPDRLNTTRLDVGVGPDSWGIVVGWGEAF